MKLKTGSLVVVGGATGYCGGHVARALHEAGYRVRALARDESRLEALGDAVDEPFEAQATQAETLRGLCDGASAVFSSLGVRSFGRKPTVWEVDRDANLNVLREAERAGVERMVFVSVFGGDRNREVLPVADAREQVADALGESPIVGTVLRPTGFFNDMSEFFNMAKGGRCWLLGDGQHRINPIHGADIGAAVVESLAADEPPKARDLGGPDAFTYREIGELAFEALGRPAHFGSLPAWTLKAFAAVSKPFNENVSTLTKMFALAAEQDALAPLGGTHHLADHFAALAGEAS